MAGPIVVAIAALAFAACGGGGTAPSPGAPEPTGDFEPEIMPADDPERFDPFDGP